MKVCFKKVHEELLLKSESLEFLHREIQKNGVIKIKRTNLNLFFYFSKTVIAQQISYLIAEKIWKQFYESYEEKKTQSKNSESQSILIDLIKELQISERKKIQF